MTSLHDKDLLLWSEEQIALLKNREFEKLDIEYLLEELDAVGKSDQHALYSYLVVLFTHILKIQYQPNNGCNSWYASCSNAKGGVNKILKRHPSYRKLLMEEAQDAYIIARKNAHHETGIPLVNFPKELPIDLEFYLNDDKF